MPEMQTGDVDTGNNHVLIAWFSGVGNSDFDENADAVTGASTNIDNGVLRSNNSYLEETVERETGSLMSGMELELFAGGVMKQYAMGF